MIFVYCIHGNVALQQKAEEIAMFWPCASHVCYIYTIFYLLAPIVHLMRSTIYEAPYYVLFCILLYILGTNIPFNNLFSNTLNTRET
jgi:hypothetical protein